MEGWISIHRQISENPLWTCEKFSRGQAWIDMLLLTNHTDSYFYKRGVRIDVKRGQLGWSEVALSERWSWSRSKVRKFLNDLKKEQQIELHKSKVTQVVTIINYDKYQVKEQQKNNRKTSKGHQKDTNNNDNNDNNEKNIPSYEEFLDYAVLCKEDINREEVRLKYLSWLDNDWEIRFKNGDVREIQNWKNTLRNTIKYMGKEVKGGNTKSGISL